MSNSYYVATGTPATSSAGNSAPMRAEFGLVAAGFDKLPVLTDNNNRVVVVNSSGTGMTTTVGELALAGNFTTTGAFNTTLAQVADVTLTLPGADGTLATLGGSEALTNKTVNGLTITTTTGTLTLTNGKTLAVSNTLTLAGTDGTTMTFPSTSATLARTDAANTFTGTQTIGALVATTINGNTFTAGTGVLTIAAGKTLTASNTLTLAGTDSTVMTFPGTSATIARTDAGQTFTGTQVFGAVTATTVNKLTLTAPATGSTLTIIDGKTVTISKTLTLTGTDSTTMTFPTTSATLARTDAANTFTGHQTIEGVTSTGATGTGNLVFSAAPTLTGHPTVEGVTSTGATGTGAFVFATSPALVTPALGVATATSLAIGGAAIGTNGLAVTGHLLLEGVTSTGATGTGSLVFAASPALTGTPTAPTQSIGDNSTSIATTAYVDRIGGFTTGDVKATLKAAADTGWVLMNDGTIGDASSGGTTRANADTSALFTLLWTNTTNANCAVSGGRGASAAADFAAHKTIALPKLLGRALASAGAGSGLTSRALAVVAGEETHLLTSGEIPAITPTASSSSTSSVTDTHTHNVPSVPGAGGSNLGASAGGNVPNISGTLATTGTASGSITVSTTTTTTVDAFGGGGAHNNMQPTSFFNFMIKL